MRGWVGAARLLGPRSNRLLRESLSPTEQKRPQEQIKRQYTQRHLLLNMVALQSQVLRNSFRQAVRCQDHSEPVVSEEASVGQKSPGAWEVVLVAGSAVLEVAEWQWVL